MSIRCPKDLKILNIYTVGIVGSQSNECLFNETSEFYDDFD